MKLNDKAIQDCADAFRQGMKDFRDNVKISPETNDWLCTPVRQHAYNLAKELSMYINMSELEVIEFELQRK